MVNENTVKALHNLQREARFVDHSPLPMAL